MDRFKGDLKNKRFYLAKKRVLRHQANKRVHTCVVAMAKFQELAYGWLSHPRCSKDLPPSDYFLIADLKKRLGRKRFSANDDIIAEANAFLRSSINLIIGKGLKNWRNIEQFLRSSKVTLRNETKSVTFQLESDVRVMRFLPNLSFMNYEIKSLCSSVTFLIVFSLKTF